MLVRLGTDIGEAMVLKYAKSLRISNNKYIADRVFINPDLSKEEAKIAYENRVSRRCRKTQRANNQDGGARVANPPPSVLTSLGFPPIDTVEKLSTVPLSTPSTSQSIESGLPQRGSHDLRPTAMQFCPSGSNPITVR